MKKVIYLLSLLLSFIYLTRILLPQAIASDRPLSTFGDLEVALLKDLAKNVIDEPVKQLHLRGEGFGPGESVLIRLLLPEWLKLPSETNISTIYSDNKGRIDTIITLPDDITVVDVPESNLHMASLEAEGLRSDSGVLLLTANIGLSNSVDKYLKKNSVERTYLESLRTEKLELGNKKKSGEYGFMKFKYTNISRDYYPDGRLQIEWYYNNGQLVGAREYYPDSALKGERHEIDILGYGRFVDYYPGGAVKSDITY